MNEYEVLFQEIEEQTKSQSLRWRQINRRDNADLILNSNLILRQFAADFTRGENHFVLLFVEKKDNDALFDSLFEKSNRIMKCYVFFRRRAARNDFLRV